MLDYGDSFSMEIGKVAGYAFEYIHECSTECYLKISRIGLYLSLNDPVFG